MKRLTPFFLLVSLGLVACQSNPASLTAAKGVNVVSPGPEVPLGIGAFVGTWAGVWTGQVNSTLVVEQVDKDGHAKGVFSWGEGGLSRGGSAKFDVQIEDGVLTAGARSFRINSDGTITARNMSGGRNNYAIMSRI